MDIGGLVAQYGQAAVIAGAFLEGETVVALAGLAAHRGYLDFATVALLAGVSALAGDQFCFFLGRRHGAKLLARFRALQEKAVRVDVMPARRHAPVIVALRLPNGPPFGGGTCSAKCRQGNDWIHDLGDFARLVDGRRNGNRFLSRVAGGANEPICLVRNAGALTGGLEETRGHSRSTHVAAGGFRELTVDLRLADTRPGSAGFPIP